MKMSSAWRVWLGARPEHKALLVAGPCVVETPEICAEVVEMLQPLCQSLGFFYIFKASYRKANRTSAGSFQGIGDEKALAILDWVRQTYQVPILTDVHETGEVARAAAVADVLQIPAFLARQTALLQAVGATGKVVNIKKGQFMSPEAVLFAAEKVAVTGNAKVILTERGTFFGYSDLVVDFRSVPRMREGGYPVLMDATHAAQQPNTGAGVTLGLRQYVALYAKLGVVAGADGIFMEVHPNPEASPSDPHTMLPLAEVKPLLEQLRALYEVR